MTTAGLLNLGAVWELLWRASWQGGLIVVAVWSICRLMPSMPGRFQAWLWRLAELKFLVILLWPLAVEIPLLPAPHLAAIEIHEPVIPAPVRIENRLTAREPPRETCSPWMLLLPAWAIGVGWQLTRLRIACRDANRLKNGGRPVDKQSLLDELASIGRSFQLTAIPKLLEIAGQGSPLLVGIARPAILIPATTLHRLDALERAIVFGHELAHVRRHDLLWNFLAAIVRAVFCFHPLTWLAQRRLKLAQEIAADEFAIARQHFEPLSYGRLLVSIVGKLGPSGSLPTMSVAAAGPIESLTRRLVALRFVNRVSRRVLFASAALLGLVALLGVVPWRLVAAEPAAPAVEPALPATGKATALDYTATIKASIGPKDKPKKVLGAFKFPFDGERGDFGMEFDHAWRAEVLIETDQQKKPVEHSVQMVVIGKLGTKTAKEYLSPRKTFIDGHDCVVETPVENGEELGVTISIAPAKPASETHLSQNLDDPNASADAARAAGNASLPPYIIEPPDILEIETRVVPKSPSKIEQPISGQHRVGPDGTVDFGKYGAVYVNGMTVEQAKHAIETQLAQFLDKPEVSVDVYSYASKVYYVIGEGDGLGDFLDRFQITGNETVLDALAQVKGLSHLSSKRIWIARPTASGTDQILPVNLMEIIEKDLLTTNYQIMAGDRIFVVESKTVPAEPAAPADVSNHPVNDRGVNTKEAGRGDNGTRLLVEGNDGELFECDEICLYKGLTADFAAKITQPYCVAKIKISVGPKDNRKRVLAEPALLFPIGRKATFEAHGDSDRLEVSIDSDEPKKPVEHSVQVKYVDNPESKTPETLVAPRVTFRDGQDCVVKLPLANGEEFEVHVSVARYTPAK